MVAVYGNMSSHDAVPSPRAGSQLDSADIINVSDGRSIAVIPTYYYNSVDGLSSHFVPRR
jgi:hypothetical protein